MAKLRFNGTEVDSEEGETVLDALSRAKLNIASSCRAGVCQACMLRCTEGTPSPKSQAGVRDTLRHQGYFLACQCLAETPMTLTEGELSPRFQKARLVDRELLSPRVSRLRLSLATPLDYQAGQFVNLRRRDGLIRSYSIANLPGTENVLELHVARIEGGAMSQWLCDRIEIGEELELRAPLGDCYYIPNKSEQNMLLVATGSGLAPIIGIARSALRAGHTGAIHLYHGSLDVDGLYLVEELQEISAERDNFHYHPCNDHSSHAWIRSGRAHEMALADHKTMTNWRVYLCGHPGMVSSMKKLAYLAGASLRDIYADAFEFVRA